jgi:hypothetical protein
MNRVVSGLLALSLLLPLLAAPAPVAAATVQPYIGLRKFATAAQFSGSALKGTVVESRDGRAYIRLASTGLGQGNNRALYGVSSPYWWGRLVSPVLAPARPFNRIIASWNAGTPPGTWTQVEARAYRPWDGHWTKYYNLGIWAYGTATIKRHSVAGQKNADGEVATDVLALSGGAVYSRMQYRLTLFTTDRSATPSVRFLSMMTSDSSKQTAGLDIPSDRQAWGVDLAVPQRSQMLYPDGGEVWCSPTSTSMVLAYWGKSVTVPTAASRTYDYTYKGHGNWPFNTAYAASFGLDGYVTRMASLSQVEEWISAGVPVVISIAWGQGELPGAPFASSGGHVIVVRGFTSSGNVIVNDPGFSTNAAVRVVYPRANLQKVWLKYSGGTVYLIHPKNRAIPTDKRYGSW